LDEKKDGLKSIFNNLLKRQIVYKRPLDFFIHLFVPANQIRNITNETKISTINYYKKLQFCKSNDEFAKLLKDFILAEDNYTKFFKKNRKCFRENPLFLEDLISWYDFKNNSCTRYESLKANKYYEVYKKKLYDLNNSKMFK